MKVAIVHDYLHQYGGAEALVNAIWEIYPQADIFSPTYDPVVMKKVGAFQGANIHYPRWKNNIPYVIRRFVNKALTITLPLYFKRLDLKNYDLVISSSAHFAKGVATKPGQLHISYIHTPPRFLYGYDGNLRNRNFWYWKILLWPLDTYLKCVDQAFAKCPDYLLCNSEEVRKRIKKIYNRDAKVIHPFPQVVVRGNPDPSISPYYAIVSRLETYKNVDLAINVCGRNKISLKVAGDGSLKKSLNDLASKFETIKMLGFISGEEKNNLYQNCIAAICAVKDEDFGMAALEPAMYGKPVIAFRRGGYLETVEENKTGVFFDELTEKSLYEAIKKLEKIKFDPAYIKKHAQKFNQSRFKKEFKEYVDNKYQEFSKSKV